MVLFLELLHMLGCRATGTGFKQTTTVHQWHNRQHLRTGAQFKNWKQVGQVVTQHVAGGRNSIFALLDSIQRESGGGVWRHDMDFKTIDIMIRQQGIYFLDELSIVSTLFV